MGGGRSGLPDTKSGWGGGGGGGGGGFCECPLETILPNFGLGRSPNSCNMQISIESRPYTRRQRRLRGAAEAPLQIFRRPLFFFFNNVHCNL